MTASNIKGTGQFRRARPLAAAVRYILALLVIAIAAYLLYRAAGTLDPAAVIESLKAYSLEHLAIVGLFAAGSYACLTGFDALAIRYVRRAVPYPYIAMASFTSLSLGHNIGFSALSSGTIRYRFYSRYGLSIADIARIILFCGVTVGLGLVTLAGLSLCTRPLVASRILGIDPSVAIWIGGACLGATAAYVLACTVIRRRVVIRGWHFELPSGRLAVGQLVIGTLNFAMVAACLHQALIGTGDINYLAVAAIYVLANGATLVSHVPGGLGVVEGVVLMFVPGEAVLAALIVFRVSYFLIPLVLGTVLFCTVELFAPRRRDRPQS